MNSIQTIRKCLSLGHNSSSRRVAHVRAARAHKVVACGWSVEARSAGVQEAEKGVKRDSREN
jgi:hypothetical protein